MPLAIARSTTLFKSTIVYLDSRTVGRCQAADYTLALVHSRLVHSWECSDHRPGLVRDHDLDYGDLNESATGRDTLVSTKKVVFSCIVDLSDT